ncbi:MAG: hypothetical protein ACRDZN_03210 [Acidimicrobiales bacterium]
MERLIELDDKRRVVLGKLGDPNHRRYQAHDEPDGTIVFTPIVAVPRSVARLLANPEFVDAMNDDSRAQVTPEEFPELFMSPDELQRWAADRTASATRMPRS